MKKIRKVNTNKRKKERVDAKQKLATQSSLMLDHHPTECCVCATPFIRTQESVKSWHVVITEGRVRLACSSCWAEVRQKVEEEG